MKEVNEIDSIMVNSMSKIIQNVRIKTEASLMVRWFKEAEEVRAEDGSLMVMTHVDDNGKPVYETIETIIERRIA